MYTSDGGRRLWNCGAYYILYIDIYRYLRAAYTYINVSVRPHIVSSYCINPNYSLDLRNKIRWRWRRRRRRQRPFSALAYTHHKDRCRGGFPAATAATVFAGCSGSQWNAFDNPSPSFNPITLLSPRKIRTGNSSPHTYYIIRSRARTSREGSTFQRLFPSTRTLSPIPHLSTTLSLSLSLNPSVCHCICNMYTGL